MYDVAYLNDEGEMKVLSRSHTNIQTLVECYKLRANAYWLVVHTGTDLIVKDRSWMSMSECCDPNSFARKMQEKQRKTMNSYSLDVTVHNSNPKGIKVVELANVISSRLKALSDENLLLKREIEALKSAVAAHKLSEVQGLINELRSLA